MEKIGKRRVHRQNRNYSLSKTANRDAASLPRSCLGHETELLVRAVYMGQIEFATYLIQQGGSMYGSFINKSDSVLEISLRRKSLQLIKFMMTRNFDIRTVNWWTALKSINSADSDLDDIYTQKRYRKEAIKFLTAAGVEFKHKSSVDSLQSVAAASVRRCLTQNGGNTFTKVPLLRMERDEEELPIVTEPAIGILLNDFHLL